MPQRLKQIPRYNTCWHFALHVSTSEVRVLAVIVLPVCVCNIIEFSYTDSEGHRRHSRCNYIISQ